MSNVQVAPGTCSLAESQDKMVDGREQGPQRHASLLPGRLPAGPAFSPSVSDQSAQAEGVLCLLFPCFPPQTSAWETSICTANHSFWKFPKSLSHLSSLLPNRMSGTVGLPAEVRQLRLRMWDLEQDYLGSRPGSTPTAA